MLRRRWTLTRTLERFIAADSIDQNPSCRQVPLSKGQFALVDAAWYETVIQVPWSAKWSASGYYAAHNMRHNGKDVTIYMHRFIVNAIRGVRVDHRNGATLDNRRHNLRDANAKGNKHNQRGQAGSRSIYKGVSRYGDSCMWVARIGVGDARRVYLGSFTTEELAAAAYNEAALRYHGEFARLNTLPMAA